MWLHFYFECNASIVSAWQFFLSFCKFPLIQHGNFPVFFCQSYEGSFRTTNQKLVAYCSWSNLLLKICPKLQALRFLLLLSSLRLMDS